MKVICNGNKTCDAICIDGSICVHHQPHNFMEHCTDWKMDCCNCTNEAYQIFLRNDKLKKINESRR